MASDTPVEQIADLVTSVRTSFNTGFTRPLEWRRAQLKSLLRFLSEKKKDIYSSVASDLRRHEQETELSEVVLVEDSIKDMISNMHRWAQPRGVSTPIIQVKGLSSSQIIPEPKGVILVMSPWNYPVQLPLLGLATAICAGNCVVLKPSEISEHSTKLIAEELPKYLDDRCLKIVLGGIPQATEVLRQRFDHIIYTGNGAVGKIVMRAAAEHLTPVTLELGGKSPVVVDEDVELSVAARRIVWGRCFNAGQSCISCDYVLVHRAAQEKLIAALKVALEGFFGTDPKTSPSLARIINKRQWERLANLIEESKREDPNSIITGGAVDEESLYIAPTLVLAKGESAVMRDEIFGPILPIIPVDSIDGAIQFINERPKPLALYVFTKHSSSWQNVIDHTSSGGLVVNDTMVQYSVCGLPFGGVGGSGFGAYHGQAGFDTFSHLKAVVNKTTWFDLDIRYPPYSESKVKSYHRMNL